MTKTINKNNKTIIEAMDQIDLKQLIFKKITPQSNNAISNSN
jgi:hypothetical protein